MSFVNRGSNGVLMYSPAQVMPNVGISLVATATVGANNTSESGLRNVKFGSVSISSGRVSGADKLLVLMGTQSTDAGAYIQGVALGNVFQANNEIGYRANSGGGAVAWALFDDPGTASENISMLVANTSANNPQATCIIYRVNNIRMTTSDLVDDGFGFTNGIGQCNTNSTRGGLLIATHRDASNTDGSDINTSNSLGWIRLTNRVAGSAYGRGVSSWYKYSSEPNDVTIQEFWVVASANTGFWSYVSLR